MPAIDVVRVASGSDNCYIVKSPSSSILVDTCKTSAREQVLSAAREHGVCAIVLTHGHFDHCQNAAYLSRKLGIPVAMNAIDYELSCDNALQKMHSNTPLGMILRIKSAREFKTEVIEPFRVASFISEGDSLAQYGVDARVVGLPGHTLGSIGIDLGEGGLIVGDALINVPNARKTMIYADAAAMEQSAERIAGLGKRTLYYGHGEPTENWLYERGER